MSWRGIRVNGNRRYFTRAAVSWQGFQAALFINSLGAARLLVADRGGAQGNGEVHHERIKINDCFAGTRIWMNPFVWPKTNTEGRLRELTILMSHQNLYSASSNNQI